jgi:hypothetical protein
MLLRVFACLALLVVVALPAAAQNAPPKVRDANGEISYSLDEAYMVPIDKAGMYEAASNVAFKEVPFSALPDFLSGQATSLAKDCTGEEKNTRLIKYYRYMSDYARNLGRSPNYIFDLMGFEGQIMRSCILGHACRDHECYLVGYAAQGGDMWQQSFTIRQRGWTHKLEKSTLKDAKPTDKLFLIPIASQAFCPPADPDKPPTEASSCVVDHIWFETGMQQYQPPSGDLAPGTVKATMPPIQQPQQQQQLQQQPLPFMEAPPSPGSSPPPATTPDDTTGASE